MRLRFPSLALPAPARATFLRALTSLALVLAVCALADNDFGGPAAPAAPATGLTQAAAAAKPNIVVVMLDDMREDELRYAPNTRKYIGQRGITFKNSFAPYPLCCPARASFLTGKYAHNHHVLYHESPYGFGSFDDHLTVAGALHAAGYQTALIGKYLNRYGIQKSKVTGRSSVHYVPNGWTDWLVGLDDGWGGSGGTYSYTNFTQNFNGRTIYHPGDYSSNVIAQQAVTLIAKYHRRANPFFMWITPVAPHFGGPAEPDDPPKTRTTNGWLVNYKTPARPSWVRGRWDRILTHAPGVRADGGPSEADISDKPRNIRTWPEATRTEKARMLELARQRAEAIYAWDMQFGKIIRALKNTGEYSNTILMFTSDNGYFLGEHRQRQGKIKNQEPVLRVPLMVAGPGIGKGARYFPFSTIDFAPTLIDLAHARRLPGMDGASRVDLMNGPDRTWNLPVVTEGLLRNLNRNWSFPSGLTISGLRTGRYKLIMYSTGPGDSELYDLYKDPLELRNLYYNADYHSIRGLMVSTWQQLRTCRTTACRVSLPTALRTTPSFLKAEHDRMLAVTSSYYDH